MYQASIRDKKKHKQFNHQKNDNYFINHEYEEFAYVKKLLGNCRTHVLMDSGIEAIGIIRGSLRKFSKRVIIETGDIVVVSKRDFQDSKVDIVHKYNTDQVQCLIAEQKLSSVLRGMYNNNSCHSSSKIETGENINDGSDIYFEETYSSDDDKSNAESNGSNGSNGSNESNGSNGSI
jgi:translation initiation factor 1A